MASKHRGIEVCQAPVAHYRHTQRSKGVDFRVEGEVSLGTLSWRLDNHFGASLCQETPLGKNEKKWVAIGPGNLLAHWKAFYRRF